MYNLSDIKHRAKYGDSTIDIGFSRLVNEFTIYNKYQVLYSNVQLSTPTFNWAAELPTVRIPYNDPSVGFLLNGKVSSHVGVYHRAPGVVICDITSYKQKENSVELVTTRNRIARVEHLNGSVVFAVRRSDSWFYIDYFDLLQAISGLPTEDIRKRFKFTSVNLKHSLNGSNVVSVAVANAYKAMFAGNANSAQDIQHFQNNRIKDYMNNLTFKSVRNYESTMSVWNRAMGATLDDDISLDLWNENGSKFTYTLREGTFISQEIAEFLSWHDVSLLRVRMKDKPYILQEDTPMLFRAVGYKLNEEIPELGYHFGDVLTNDMVKAINNTKRLTLNVSSPNGAKLMIRSNEKVELGDFITLYNVLLTSDMHEEAMASEYEISNRIVINYSKRVEDEVMRVYQEIANALLGQTSLAAVINALPKLPSNYLYEQLRNIATKEKAQAEVTNIMSRAIAMRRASAMVDSAPPAMMAVQKGQCGRIDSMHSPESDQVGAVQQLTFMAEIDEFGRIQTPYQEVKNGKLTDNIVMVDAAKEVNKCIAQWDDPLTDDIIKVRCNDEVITVPRERVDYRDASPFCDMSVSRMTIPFPEYSQPKRSLMATKMAGQALPLLHPERPLVSTGADTIVPCLYYTMAQVVYTTLGITEDDIKDDEVLEVLGVDWTRNSADYTCFFRGQKLTYSAPYIATDKKSLFNYNINVQPDNKYHKNDIMFYNHSCDLKKYDMWIRESQGAKPLIKSKEDFAKPAMALGVNLVVAYKTYGSNTVDDAVVINSRLIKNHKLSNLRIIRYHYDLSKHEKFPVMGALAGLHTHVYTGEPLITWSATSNHKGNYKVTTKSIFADHPGDVILSEISDDEQSADVWVAEIHDAAIGDKVAGRYGNKSVIARIVPEEEMPYDPETGLSPDIICSPLGIPSRMNYGQIIEVALGGCMKMMNKAAAVTPFYKSTGGYGNFREEVEALVKECGMEPKRLYNPIYGRYTERPVMVGVMYFLKLEQLSDTKYSTVGIPGSIDPVFGQPVASLNTDKGQAVSEWELWAMIATGADKTLRNLFTMHAADEFSRKRYLDYLRNNPDGYDGWSDSDKYAYRYKEVNKDSLATQVIARSFGMDIHADGDKYYYLPLNMDNIGVCLKPHELRNDVGDLDKNEWSKVELKAPFINPFWIEHFPLGAILGFKYVKQIIDGKKYLRIDDLTVKSKSQITPEESPYFITGVTAIIEAIRNTTIEKAIYNLSGINILNDSNAGSLASFATDSIDEDEESDEEIHSTTFKVIDGAETSSGEEESIESSTNKASRDYENSEDHSFDGVGDLEQEFSSDNGDGDDILMGKNVSDMVYVIQFLKRLKAAGMTLQDLIWDHLPVLPKVFRQPSLASGSSRSKGQTVMHPFQKQLMHIVNASNSDDIYKAYYSYLGSSASKSSDLTTIRGFFFSTGQSSGHHGAVRDSMLRKRVGMSGRTVIVPAADITMPPYCIGIPWVIAMTELATVLAIRLIKRIPTLIRTFPSELYTAAPVLSALTERQWENLISSLYKYNNRVFKNLFPSLDRNNRVYIYNLLRKEIETICCGNVNNRGLVFYNGKYCRPEELPDDAELDCSVVQVGRQPTLHSKSIRVFFMRLVDGYSMHIHPLVCSGFNADFDGDTMYNIQLFGSAKINGWKSFSVLKDLISEKDGSYTIAPAQDIALGLYCMTLFKDNTKEFQGRKNQFKYYDNLEELETQLTYGELHYYDAIIYKAPNGNKYIGTAGRVILNASVPGALTSAPFNDPAGVCKAVLGAEFIKTFKQMAYDDVWVVTGTRPVDRPKAIKVESILKTVYESVGERAVVDCTQRLYELGLTASDMYSVTAQLEDMRVDGINVSEFMKEPDEKVQKLISLEQLGLISERERKTSSSRAWDTAKKKSMGAVVNAINPNSNTHFLMYSGARGKPDQVMQTVGFIGSISKTASTDIEYPILESYGSGLGAINLTQTRYMARIGVVSTQSGTKDTGYATRQTVYMTSGLCLDAEDCGINNHTREVEYDYTDLYGVVGDAHIEADKLTELFADPGDPRLEHYLADLSSTGFMLTESIIERMLTEGLMEFSILGNDRKVHDLTLVLKKEIRASWKQDVLESGYSYALPYTDNFKITERSLEWVEHHHMDKIICYSKDDMLSGKCFDLEAYLPVEYDRSKYTVSKDGVVVNEKPLYGAKISKYSDGFKYYKNLLDSDGGMTAKAMSYLTKKQIRSFKTDDGQVYDISYSITSLFKDLVVDRSSIALPLLDDGRYICKATLKEIERVQLQYIPVNTLITCLRHGNACIKCKGGSIDKHKKWKVGDNIGIAAAETQCEPIAQGTMNVHHSGGRRSAGTGLVSGARYYMKMLKYTPTPPPPKNKPRPVTDREQFSLVEGYLYLHKHDPRFYDIVSEDGHVILSGSVPDPTRLACPDGAYIDVGDTLIAGSAELDRYRGRDIFQCALKTRYLLLQEYNKVFSGMHVSPKNFEIISRAQTSICYYVGPPGEEVSLRADDATTIDLQKDTSQECADKTGLYELRMSRQPDVVQKFSGLSSFSFENAPDRLRGAVMAPKGLPMRSTLSNILTGTPVGSTEAKFIEPMSTTVKLNKSGSIEKDSFSRALQHMKRTRQDTLNTYNNMALEKGERTGIMPSLYSGQSKEDNVISPDIAMALHSKIEKAQEALGTSASPVVQALPTGYLSAVDFDADVSEATELNLDAVPVVEVETKIVDDFNAEDVMGSFATEDFDEEEPDADSMLDAMLGGKSGGEAKGLYLE